MEKQPALRGNVIALDFDGVLHSYRSGWTGYEPRDLPESGAREFLDWLLDQGAKVVVVSTRARTRRGTRAIRNWLRLHGFPELDVTHRKVRAAAYVDDRAVSYTRGDWASCRSEVLRLIAKSPGDGAPLLPDEG